MNKKSLIKDRFENSLESYDLMATVQDSICNELCDKIAALELFPQRILEVGAGTGFLTRRLAVLFPCRNFTINDITENSYNFVSRYIDNCNFILGDAENIELGENYDLICSSSTVQWFDKFPLFASKVYRKLCSGGYFVFSTFGTENFRELRSTTGVGLDYLSKIELENLMQVSGFEVVGSYEQLRQMNFQSPREVLHHIKVTGVGLGDGRRWTKGRLEEFERMYTMQFADTKGVKLTYHPIMMLCKKL